MGGRESQIYYVCISREREREREERRERHTEVGVKQKKRKKKRIQNIQTNKRQETT